MGPGELMLLLPMQTLRPVYKFILFLAGLLVINAFLSWAAFRYLPYAKNRRYKRDAQFARIDDTLDFIFIGNSHLNRGLEPDSIPRSWAFHGPTETAPYFYYRLKTILEERPQAARFYVFPAELGITAFNPQPLMFMGDYWKRYVDFIELAQYTPNPSFYYGIALKLKVAPYYQLPAALMFLYDLQKERKQYKKYLKDTWADYDQQMKDTILQYMLDRHTLFGEESNAIGWQYVQKMVQLAQSKDVNLIFVKWPLHPLYEEGVRAHNIVSDTMNAKVEHLLQQAENVWLLDFQDRFDGNDTLFYDPHHLSKVGKLRFTKLLRDTLLAIKAKEFPINR